MDGQRFFLSKPRISSFRRSTVQCGNTSNKQGNKTTKERQPLPTRAGSPVQTYGRLGAVLVATLIPKAVREGAQDPHLKRQASGSMKMLMT
jgi:hypothetical protein